MKRIDAQSNDHALAHSGRFLAVRPRPGRSSGVVLEYGVTPVRVVKLVDTASCEEAAARHAGSGPATDTGLALPLETSRRNLRNFAGGCSSKPAEPPLTSG